MVSIARVIATGLLLLASSAVPGPSAQQAPAQKPLPRIERASTKPIASIDGKDNYDAYCAVCHGIGGKGDGPAAPAMKAPMPDLTTLAQRNKGRFDTAHVEYVIKGTGRTRTPAHGVEEMPIWGDVFRYEGSTRAMLRIGNLVKYVESLQMKAGTASH